MSVAGFFVLLAIAVATRMMGKRLAPLLMPDGRFLPLASAWAGGLAASWIDNAVWQFGPRVAGISVVAAFAGSAAALLILGIAPFVRILIGRGQ